MKSNGTGPRRENSIRPENIDAFRISSSAEPRQGRRTFSGLTQSDVTKELGNRQRERQARKSATGANVGEPTIRDCNVTSAKRLSRNEISQSPQDL